MKPNKKHIVCATLAVSTISVDFAAWQTTVTAEVTEDPEASGMLNITLPCNRLSAESAPGAGHSRG